MANDGKYYSEFEDAICDMYYLLSKLEDIADTNISERPIIIEFLLSFNSTGIIPSDKEHMALDTIGLMSEPARCYARRVLENHLKHHIPIVSMYRAKINELLGLN